MAVSGDCVNRLASLEARSPLFTELPRRVLPGNRASGERGSRKLLSGIPSSRKLGSIRKAGAVRSHSDLVSNVSMWGPGEYYALRCIGSRRKRRQVTQQKAGVQGPWLYDRRVRWLLELTIEADMFVRFGIEGIDSQCIIALEERLLVIKPGFVRGGVFGAKAASIREGDVTSIETNPAASNLAIKINALDYQLNESHNEIYQGNHGL